MIRRSLFALFIALSSLYCFGEDFDITSYHVAVAINADGSLDITETLGLNFTSERHGLIRDIPFRYNFGKQEDFERAERDEAKGFYEIMFKDVNVDGFEFETYKEGDNFCIKIGSADKYLSGAQEMTIHYKVWGALNIFSDHTEFYWNIIGHAWTMPIRNISYSITLPGNFRPGSNDILLYKGQTGSTDQSLQYRLNGNTISGTYSGPLEAYEGITLAIRFPLSVFKSTEIPITEMADKFYIELAESKVNVRKNGELEVTDQYRVAFLQPQSVFYRSFYIPGFADKTSNDFHDFYVFDATASLDSDPERAIHAYINGSGDNKYLSLEVDTGALRGTAEITFHYHVSGAYNSVESIQSFHWQVAGGFGEEPIRNFSFQVSADSGISLYSNNLSFYENNLTSFRLPVVQNKGDRILKGTLDHTLYGGNSLYINLLLYSSDLTLKALPTICYAKNYLVKSILCRIEVREDGSLHIRKEYDLDFLGPIESYGQPEVITQKVFYEDDPLGVGLEMSMPNWSLIGSYSKILLSNYTFDAGSYNYETDDGRFSNSLKLFPVSQDQADRHFSVEYDLFGLIEKQGDYYILNMPIGEVFSDPVEQCNVEIILPDKGSLIRLEGKYYYADATQKIPMSLRIVGNKVTGESNLGYIGQIYPMIWLKIPADMLDISSGLRFKTFWVNNHPFMIPLILLVILFVLWVFYGRDRRASLVVAYKPPDDLTPAEAGFIWDFKLQRRDLVSLIYYWAGKGYISITESGEGSSRDYTLTKLKELPASAKGFENTMFKGLFSTENSRKVSSLRNSFYATMNTASKELKKEGRGKGFYLPGSRQFSILLQTCSWFLIVYGSFHILFASYNNLQVMIGYLLAFAMLQFFGRIMPKRAPFGSKKFQELRGFREFIKRAEYYKLKELLEENPAYFDETVSFAIVMGLGNQWAEKFKDLISSAPSYYQGQSGVFDTRIFMHSVISSMYKMETDFHYKYTPRSGSSSGYSSSGSFTFHSSGGGGFSSFGGGGHSGGGFGGGGGRSW